MVITEGMPMNKLVAVPPQSLLTATAVNLPTHKQLEPLTATRHTPLWEIAYVGKKELPVLQFKAIEPRKVFSSIVFEFGLLPNGHLVGKLLLPPGLRPLDGAGLKVDGEAISKKLPFNVLIREGAVVNLNLGLESVKALSEGNILGVHCVIASSKKAIAFNIPLEGFDIGLSQLKAVIEQRNAHA
jgi:hypothetical protein